MILLLSFALSHNSGRMKQVASTRGNDVRDDQAKDEREECAEPLTEQGKREPKRKSVQVRYGFE